MDKINEIKNSTLPLPARSNVRQQDGSAFMNALNEAIAPKSVPKTETAMTGTLGEIQSFPFHPVTEAPEGIAQATQTLLDRLDDYSRSLADPSKSLKEIEPLITDLKDRADDLTRRTGEETGKETAIQRIANESAQLALMEYMRFYRGDYV